MAIAVKNKLVSRLPAVAGRLTENAPLGHLTWFGVGGPAEVLFRPADRADLVAFIRDCPADVPLTVIGLASNMIIRDGGIPGVVIRLGRDFADIAVDGLDVVAGAAALDVNLSLTAAKHGIAGLEFFSGVPGSVGGALRMNAGAYGGETKDVLVSAEVLFRDGTIRDMTPDEMQMAYRHNGLPPDVVFLSARFRGHAGEVAAIEKRIDEIKAKRMETQPIKTKTGGSTFANPDGHSAWKLVDTAGCRGLMVGGAQVSEMHCNFLINTGNATAADIERLGEEVRRRVYETSGIRLRWEIRRIGVPRAEDSDIAVFMAQEEGKKHG